MMQHIELARDGDPSATKSLVMALNPRITKMAFHYARRSGEDPDDLFQEAWLGLLEALPEIDVRIGTPEQYLLQRARWRMLDAIKRAKVRKCLQLDEATRENIQLDTGADNPLSVASVSAFFEQLKSTQRLVLKCLLAGLTFREAGRMLGCTSANVAYHVRQIRQQYEAWSEDNLATRTSQSTKSLEARSQICLQEEVGDEMIIREVPAQGAGRR